MLSRIRKIWRKRLLRLSLRRQIAPRTLGMEISHVSMNEKMRIGAARVALRALWTAAVQPPTAFGPTRIQFEGDEAEVDEIQAAEGGPLEDPWARQLNLPPHWLDGCGVVWMLGRQESSGISMGWNRCGAEVRRIMQRMLPSATGCLLLLVANTACQRHGAERPSPVSQRWNDFHPPYPAVLREAGVNGTVAFHVRMDSAGHPVMSTFTVEQSTNGLFTAVVKRALGTAQASALRVVRDTVMFRVFRNATDSVEACTPNGGATVICGRQPEPKRMILH